jgi:hypothetical protein
VVGGKLEALPMDEYIHARGWLRFGELEYVSVERRAESREQSLESGERKFLE